MNRNQWLMAGCIGVAGIVLPFGVESPVWMTVLNLFFYYAMLSISWNIVFGYAGLFSFGHVAFAAVGGYASGLIAIHPGFPFLGPSEASPTFVGIVWVGLSSGERVLSLF
jgi:branched-chain amino acid transport system permease protein